MLSRSWLRRGAAWWFVIPAAASIIAVVGAITLTRQPVFLAWPFVAAASDLRSVRVVALRRQPRRTFAAERRGRGDVSGGGDLWRRGAGADAAVSERRDRARAAQRRLRRTEGRRGRLSRAKPGVHDRHLDGADGWIGRRGFSGAGQLPVRAGGAALGTRLCPARRSHRACATTSPPASTATTFRRAERFRSRSSAPRVRSKMSARAGDRRILELFCRILRPRAGVRWHNSCARHRIRGAPRRRGDRRAMCCCSRRSLGAAIIVLMYALDAAEIGLMPPRGTASLWPVRILTDFGKSAYVLWSLAGLIVRRRACFPAIARNFAIPAARTWDASAVSVFRGAGAGSRRRSHQMDRRTRPAVRRVVTPTPSTSRTLPEPKPMPAFRRVMPSRASRWLSRSPRSGRARGPR